MAVDNASGIDSTQMIERVLIVGLGSAGRRHLEIVRRLCPSADIRILRQNSFERDLDSTEDLECVITSLKEAQYFVPEVAVLCNPAPSHVSLAMTFAEMGSHLLIEKPLSDSTKEVVPLLNVCRNNGRILQVGYNLRYSSSLCEFRNELKQELIGEVFSIRCEVGQWLPSWRPATDYRKTVSANRLLGGGALLELSHEIDYLGWIFGSIDWVRATLVKSSSLEIDVEDTASLILGLRKRQHSLSPFCSLTMDFVRHDATRRCQVMGERGVLLWDGLKGEVSLLEAGDSKWKILHSFELDLQNSYLNEWRDFLKCIEEGGKPLVTGEDGLSVLAVVEAARESSATGRQVSVQTTHELLGQQP